MKAMFWIACLVACGGGGKDEPAEGAKPESKPEQAEAKPADKLSAARSAVVDAWKQAGLSASLAPGAGFGKDCSTGTVDKLDVMICEYGSAGEAKQAEKPGLEWVGATTGAAWSAGSLVIAVADRKKADPHGKTINQLMKAAPK